MKKFVKKTINLPFDTIANAITQGERVVKNRLRFFVKIKHVYMQVASATYEKFSSLFALSDGSSGTVVSKGTSYKIILLFLLSFFPLQAAELSSANQSLEFAISAKQHAKMQLALIIMGSFNEQLAELAAVMKKDLEFSGQFEVEVRTCKAINSKKDLQVLADEGYTLAVFLNESKQGFFSKNKSTAYEWRLYDTQLAQMMSGKKYEKRGDVVRGWAHQIADALWLELTAQEGFFSTKIAYCKEIKGKKGKRLKHIYVADYDGSHEQRIVSTPTINVAPRFNHDQQKPVLFYSESTNANIRMMLVDMNKKRKIASNFDGINMLPSFSSDGTKLVYCASHGHGSCQLYYYEKGTFKQITNNSGNNISPSLSDDGKRLYYCSDYQTGKPQIFCYNLETGDHINITKCNESCFSPSYHNKKGLLAYAKMLKGTMQLFVYDEKKGTHRQLTFDGGNKDECSWSPCGNFLLYSIEDHNKGRLALLNLMTHKHTVITAQTDVCSYPTWSPAYAQFPVVA